MLLAPQPVWVSPAVFVENYHPLQNLPYFLGFLLIGGMLMVVSGHYLNVSEDRPVLKLRLLMALGWTIAFVGLIAFNYICQTTFVHNMAVHYKTEYDAAISAFSMSNPTSFCWANEMWGYALLGVATWMMAEYYAGRNEIIRWLLILNGVMSIAGVVWTIVDIFWVLTVGGLVAYFLWNVLMIVLMVLIWRDAKSR